MPTPTIPKGSDYFNAYLWSGNSTEPRSFTGVGFQPDFWWTKTRNAGSSQHVLIDSVRGVNGQLASDNNDAEDTTNFAIKLDSFDSNGFTLSKGSNATYGYYAGNLTGRNYVGWQWKAGGTAVTNTVGTISAQVSANTTSGFSVITYTGNSTDSQTVGHGLGIAPQMVIVKSRNATNYWAVWNTGLPSLTYNVYLNATDGQTTDSQFNSMSSTTVGVRNGGSVNQSGTNYVMYCFAPIAGYSAFGNYTGNGSADGVFVYTGFRPRWLMVKVSAGTTGAWYILDTSINSYNEARTSLQANSSAAEVTDTNFVDILSNGFKLRTNGGAVNGSGSTYIYAAFAENPFKYANAR
jgi:hypothetical protein